MTVDVEGGLRAWFRTLTFDPDVGSRVFVDVAGAPTLPYITVGLIDAQDDTSDAPLDRALVQIDAWAATKRDAQSLYMGIRTSLRNAPSGLTLTPGTRFLGCQIQPGTAYLPDADDGTPRYVITAEIIVGP